MSSLTLLQSLHESLSTRAQVKSVFGEPIIAGDKTIIPVAKIAYGFGGGTGSGGLEIKTAVGSLLRSLGIDKVEKGVEPPAVEGPSRIVTAPYSPRSLLSRSCLRIPRIRFSMRVDVACLMRRPPRGMPDHTTRSSRTSAA